ncbi:hypothetical protein [Gloeocapsopsis sp. IPPAS B-1203]|uniref:hypothetical protein n=1 Tax=Gloeocapsopsis sp. IPPAS B-1203 TaxID=2049454 RepID=UPI000C19B45C|nr:hypothetical protein [Gloeocapsopsis sp. IPPAS B-1203]PIG93713.1 hypothetical protein CSQ79_08775 [Gloeocapsopsis sp. IPPAS B-1203]
MQHLIEAVEQALAQQNWYAALALALTLPDICGWLEHPNKRTGERYKDWFRKYIGNQNSFPSTEDFYLLRCAYLHSGSDDISDKKARDVSKRFCFTKPSEFVSADNNMVKAGGHFTAQLQVDNFCRGICEGVKLWEKDVAIKDGVQERLRSGLMKIYPPEVFLQYAMAGFISIDD